MPVQFPNTVMRGRENKQAEQKVRLYNQQTGDYVAMCGDRTTKNRDHSWLGFKHQAELLKTRARGDFDDFEPVHRNIFGD